MMFYRKHLKGKEIAESQLLSYLFGAPLAFLSYGPAHSIIPLTCPTAAE